MCIPSIRSSDAESKPKTSSAGSSATSSSLGFQQVQSQHQEHMNSVLDPPPPAPNGSMEAKHNINNDSSSHNASFLGIPDGLVGKPFSSGRNGVFPPPSSWCNYTHLGATEKNGNVPSISK